MQRISLFDDSGNRKYLTPEERELFRQATGEVSRDWRMFGLMLYFTGCRLSEALNIKVKDVEDLENVIDIVPAVIKVELEKLLKTAKEVEYKNLVIYRMFLL